LTYFEVCGGSNLSSLVDHDERGCMCVEDSSTPHTHIIEQISCISHPFWLLWVGAVIVSKSSSSFSQPVNREICADFKSFITCRRLTWSFPHLTSNYLPTWSLCLLPWNFCLPTRLQIYWLATLSIATMACLLCNEFFSIDFAWCICMYMLRSSWWFPVYWHDSLLVVTIFPLFSVHTTKHFLSGNENFLILIDMTLV